MLVKTQAKRGSQFTNKIIKNKNSSNVTMKDYRNYPPEEIYKN
jgi:hypothetical protein